MSRRAPVSSKRAGENAEGAIVEVLDWLTYVPDDELQHVDARVIELVEPSESLPLVGTCPLAVGTLVGVKSAIPRLASGDRGRFYLRQNQHDSLLEAGGSYLFTVCEPRRARHLQTPLFGPLSAILFFDMAFAASLICTSVFRELNLPSFLNSLLPTGNLSLQDIQVSTDGVSEPER